MELMPLPKSVKIKLRRRLYIALGIWSLLLVAFAWTCSESTDAGGYGVLIGLGIVTIAAWIVGPQFLWEMNRQHKGGE